eukprot:TRINITY_DN1108_c0_g1_i1.p1 TRINITY_DN1108_c0_g1~~TRINITY_DN1108_c0_g1_i1.p1  ORF type:complete len:240 (-),score=61.51 TRINITY_DN1108_c0_g1_i1:44-739(-)
MSLIETLQGDLAELQALRAQATRQRAQRCLDAEIKAVNAALSAEADRQTREKEREERKAREAAFTATPAAVLAQEITNYAWDQSQKAVKIYVSALKDCGGLSTENCVLQCKEISFNLFVTAPSGKRYRLSVGPLFAAILPDESSVRAKPDGSVVITLRKASSSHWDSVKAKEEKFKAPPAEKDEDPNKSIMKLMQNLYEDGDEEMKRTIAKAFSESRSGKKPEMPDLGADF